MPNNIAEFYEKITNNFPKIIAFLWTILSLSYIIPNELRMSIEGVKKILPSFVVTYLNSIIFSEKEFIATIKVLTAIFFIATIISIGCAIKIHIPNNVFTPIAVHSAFILISIISINAIANKLGYVEIKLELSENTHFLLVIAQLIPYLYAGLHIFAFIKK